MTLCSAGLTKGIALFTQRATTYPKGEIWPKPEERVNKSFQTQQHSPDAPHLEKALMKGNVISTSGGGRDNIFKNMDPMKRKTENLTDEAVYLFLYVILLPLVRFFYNFFPQ